MSKMLTFTVHTEYDAYELLARTTDFNLKFLQLNCFVEHIGYLVYFDIEKSRVVSQAYPFCFRNVDIRQDFKDAIFAIYHTNFL